MVLGQVYSRNEIGCYVTDDIATVSLFPINISHVVSILEDKIFSDDSVKLYTLIFKNVIDQIFFDQFFDQICVLLKSFILISFNCVIPSVLTSMKPQCVGAP